MQSDGPAPTSLPDIQRTVDERSVRIKRVGVTNIRMPVNLLRGGNKSESLGLLRTDYCQTVGTFELAVDLPPSVKGTHMSRFTEVLNRHVNSAGVFGGQHLQKMVVELRDVLEASNVFLRLVVDYFVHQTAPKSGAPGVAPLTGVLEIEIHNDRIYTRTGIIAIGKTCCPCSREISDFDPTTRKGKGAHAQRSEVSILVAHEPTALVWFEDLLEVARASFSSPVYPVLKRPDERAVTVGAYENPKFVEDVVRDVVVGLRADPNVRGMQVRVQNAESIHYHDAYAEVTEGDMTTAGRLVSEFTSYETAP